MSDEPEPTPDSGEAPSTFSATMFPSGDSFTAEVTRRRLRGRLFGDAGGSLEVGPFELRERIGAGAMGTVYAAWDTRLARTVALKFLFHRSERDEELGLREAQALASLAHPNVVSVFDVGTYEGRVWLAMEFIVGSTMRAWVEERRAAEILACWAAVGRGLAAVHALNLVHRDVKPDNVLVDEQGRARLVDFGLVCAAQTPVSTVSSGEGETLAQTSAGFAGTRAYAAPEQIQGEPVDGRADQYAFCVSVWESLTGSRPARDARGALRAGAGAKLPRRVRRALRRGLAIEPEQRFASMDELLSALTPRPLRPWLVLGFAVTALAGTLAGLGLQPDRSHSTPCLGADAAIDELWTIARREALEERSPELALELESWVGEWRRAARNTCLARWQLALSAQLAERRRACLDRRLLELESALDWLSAPPRLGVDGVPTLVDPAVCLSASLPPSSVPPAELSDQIARLRRELDRVERDGARPSAAAIAQGEAALAKARALGWPRLVGEATLVAAKLHRFAGEVEAASELIGQAIDIAQHGSDDELAFAAWLSMVWLKTGMEFDPDGARWAWERLRAASEALGEPALYRGALAHTAGNIARLRGDPRSAEVELRRALEHYEHAGVTGRYRQIQVLDLLAATLAIEGRSEDSEHAAERSEQLRRALGDAPDGALQREGDHAFSAGLARFAAGELDAARDELERALSSYEQGHDEGQRTTQVLVALASVEDAANRRVEARHYAELADAVCVTRLSGMHPLRASTQSAIGTIALRDGRAEQAVDAFTRALELETALQPEAGTDRALANSNLAEALVAAGRYEEARVHAERALAALGEALGEDHPDLAYPHKAMGQVLLAEGRADAAAEHLQQAIDLHGETQAHSPELDELHTLLAQAEAGVTGDHP
jgi:tetratricopeptide (TPR) repeat protein